jgi:transposase
MAERVLVCDLTNDEGRKLLSIVRRGSGSVVRWRRAQIVLWSAQRMDVPAIAKIAFTSEDRVRAVIHNFNDDGFDSLAPKYAGGRPPTFTLPQRREIKKIALSRPSDHDLPFSTWSLSKLAEFLVAEGVVDDISHEGLRVLLGEEGVSFQVIKTFKVSNDPDFEQKKNRVLGLYDIADGKALPGPGDPTVVICMDEFGPLNLQPHPGKQWAPVAAGNGDSAVPRRRRRRATFNRPHGVRHLLAGYDLSTDRLYGHVKCRRAAPSSSRSAATYDHCIRPGCGSRSCWTTGARTAPRRKTPGLVTGPRRTTSSSRTCRSTRRGSTASRPNSLRCVTSPSTEPTTPPTKHKAA